MSGTLSSSASSVGDAARQRGITCGLCFNILEEPATFECSHSFCAGCVRAQLEYLGSSGFLCPLCSKLHDGVSSDNLSDLADSALMGYVRRRVNGEEEAPVCQWCEEVGATVLCNECMGVYCAECDSAVHKSAAKRSHARKDIEDLDTLRGVQRSCSVPGHNEYRAAFYCSRCEELCCAYCLLKGNHKDHENTDLASAAAVFREQLPSDLSLLTQARNQLEEQVSQLNSVTAMYFDTYEEVENVVSDRFNYFKLMLLQHEAEVRKKLMKLREEGDASLMRTRKQLLCKVNALNEAVLRFQRMQQGCGDYEVLESRSMVFSHLRKDVPLVMGTGFKFVGEDEICIPEMNVFLELDVAPSLSSTGNLNDKSLATPSRGVTPSDSSCTLKERRRASCSTERASADGENRMTLRQPPLRLKFPPCANVEATNTSDGLLLHGFRCTRGDFKQIGLRCNDTMEQIVRAFPEDGGLVKWRVRLEDGFANSFVGIAEKTKSPIVPDGFYWRPAARGVLDGFVCNVVEGTLSVAVNGREYGVLLTDVHPRVMACFIFSPGESVTLLY
uniref:Putative conserved zinc-finger protein n=1 Tax=Trypanosoma vivax (strain Y486) TaxID=1055687 RepID=G0TX32_TRYVY|nr:putative conserved zinc-finger protein, fragment [Trypanosoma vivax Y486]